MRPFESHRSFFFKVIQSTSYWQSEDKETRGSALELERLLVSRCNIEYSFKVVYLNLPNNYGWEILY